MAGFDLVRVAHELDHGLEHLDFGLAMISAHLDEPTTGLDPEVRTEMWEEIAGQTAEGLTDLMPGWMQTAADFNPVNWAVEAGRAALSASPDWGEIALRAGLLATLLAAMTAFAVRAFRAYQRSA